MSITHAGFSFTHDHGPLKEGPPEVNNLRYQFPGVKGEDHLDGQTKGHDITTFYNITGRSSPADLKSVIDQLRDKAGNLSGTLSVSGDFSASYGDCTFIGFYPDQLGEHWDASGINDWCCFGTLVWRSKGI